MNHRRVMPGLCTGMRGFCRRSLIGLDDALASFSGCACADLFKRLYDALAVERFQQVVNCVYLECLHGVLVECRSEDDLWQAGLAVKSHQLLQYCKTIQPRHAHVEEDDVRLVCADQLNGLDAVRPLRENCHVTIAVKKVLQLLACERFVVDDQRCEGHEEETEEIRHQRKRRVHNRPLPGFYLVYWLVSSL